MHKNNTTNQNFEVIFKIIFEFSILIINFLSLHKTIVQGYTKQKQKLTSLMHMICIKKNNIEIYFLKKIKKQKMQFKNNTAFIFFIFQKKAVIFEKKHKTDEKST